MNAIGLPKFMIHINQAFCFGFGHRRTADVAKILLTTVNGKNDVITNDAEGYEGLDEKIKALFHEKRDELTLKKTRLKRPTENETSLTAGPRAKAKTSEQRLLPSGNPVRPHREPPRLKRS